MHPTLHDSAAPSPRPTMEDPRLVSREARFCLAGPLEIWIEDDALYAFWQAARPLVHRGASALELAAGLRLDPDRCRLALGRLWMLGLLRPLPTSRPGVRRPARGMVS